MTVWFLNFFKPPPDKRTQAIHIFNENFKKFLSSGSWFVYLICGLLAVICIYFFFIDQTRKRAIIRRRREIRRANEKPPQKRRPGAASRNHEIYRTVMEKVQHYIDPCKKDNLVFRQTRSGTIYGQFAEKAT